MKESGKILIVNIEHLIPNKYQPRKIFNDNSLKELAASIKEYGILNPILVRQLGDKYEIIAGERRYRAAKMAGLSEVPVIIKNVDENKLAEMALIENLQRENISPIEEAESYENILNLSSLTEQRLSEMIGKSQSFISNKLRLLKLPNNIKEALSQRKISERHARSLLTIDDETKQTELLNRVIDEKLTVKELDNIINEKQITEDEINKAIDDIMKTLEISEEEKKEEKESDNMNNGNFFPNMNQNMPQGNMGASLNTMNMQTLATPQMNSQPQMTQNMSLEQASPIPSFGPAIEQPEMQPMAPNPMPDYSMPMQEQPTFDPVPQENYGIPSSDTMVAPQPEPVSPIPTFGPSIEQPEMQAMAPNPTPDYSMPSVEQPLFNSEANFGQPAYEVPVATNTGVDYMSQSQDKLDTVQNFLNSNGIQYKSYSNEIGHCIIIEL